MSLYVKRIRNALHNLNNMNFCTVGISFKSSNQIGLISLTSRSKFVIPGTMYCSGV